MLSELNFDYVRSVLPHAGWDDLVHPLPNLVVRHGENGMFGARGIPSEQVSSPENFGSDKADWYKDTFDLDPRYRFAGHARIIQVYSYGQAYEWMEQLVPHPAYVGIIGRPGDQIAILTQERLYFLPPAEHFNLIYADRDGARMLTVSANDGWRLRLAMHQLENNPGMDAMTDIWRCN